MTVYNFFSSKNQLTVGNVLSTWSVNRDCQEREPHVSYSVQNANWEL